MNQYKEIKGFPNYKINKNGNVLNVKFNKILKGNIKLGYPVVKISNGVKKHQKFVHRLIAEHFIPNPHKKPFVNHLNGNTKDYSIQNLEWCTAKENIYHSRNLSKNGAVISRKKIDFLYNENKNLNIEDLINLLKDNCK